MRSSEMETLSGENKHSSDFNVLLEPIRELSASWSIDVAKELTLFAASLGFNLSDSISNEHVDSNSSIDFAQAALVVQGSTSIYSRKVEHLYSLVYASVASLHQLQVRKQTSQGHTEDNNTDPDGDQVFDDEFDFLTLDDWLPEVDPKHVTLPPQDFPPHGSPLDMTCFKPIPPMLIQQHSDAAQVAGTRFNILSTHLHPSGALIMRGCPPLDENLETLPPNPHNALYENMESVAENETALDHDDFDEVGFSTPPPAPEVDDGHDDVLVAVASSARKRGGRRTFLLDKDELVVPKRDPFILLDPHEKIVRLDKELKVGKTFRKPRKTAVADKFVQFDSNGKNHFEMVDMLLGPIYRGTSIRNCMNFKGARECYRSVLKKRRAKRRELKRKNILAHPTFDDNDDVWADLEEQEEEEDLNEMGLNTVRFEDDEDEEIEIPSFPNLAEGDEFGAASGDVLDITNGCSPLGAYQDQLKQLASSYEETCRKYLERTRGLWEQRSLDVKLAKRVESWASRIQPILAEEEKRPAFDIGLYGTKILSQLSQRQEKHHASECSMSSVFHASSNYDVCRMFLATLELANSHSLEIVQPQNCCVSDPSIRVISKMPKPVTPTRSGLKRMRDAGGTPLSLRAKRKPLRQIMNI